MVSEAYDSSRESGRAEQAGIASTVKDGFRLERAQDLGVLDLATVPRRFFTLDDFLEYESRPSQALVDYMRQQTGPHKYCIAGGTGKNGPSQAVLIRRALDLAGVDDPEVHVIGRYSGEGGPRLQDYFKKWGVTPQVQDLSRIQENPELLALLRDCSRIMYMAGRKFDTKSDVGQQVLWQTNTTVLVDFLRALGGTDCKVVTYESGNLYGALPIEGNGATANSPIRVDGDYGFSVKARNRLTEYYAKELGIPVVRGVYYYGVGSAGINGLYGTLRDVADWVHRGDEVPLTSPVFNWIWQNNVGEMMARLFDKATTEAPPYIVTGHKVSVRDVAMSIAEKLGRRGDLRFGQTTYDTAILGDPAETLRQIPVALLPTDHMIDIVANWYLDCLPNANMPTGFQKRPDMGEGF